MRSQALADAMAFPYVQLSGQGKCIKANATPTHSVAPKLHYLPTLSEGQGNTETRVATGLLYNFFCWLIQCPCLLQHQLVRFIPLYPHLHLSPRLCSTFYRNPSERNPLSLNKRTRASRTTLTRYYPLDIRTVHRHRPLRSSHTQFPDHQDSQRQ